MASIIERFCPYCKDKLEMVDEINDEQKLFECKECSKLFETDCFGKFLEIE